MTHIKSLLVAAPVALGLLAAPAAHAEWRGHGGGGWHHEGWGHRGGFPLGPALLGLGAAAVVGGIIASQPYYAPPPAYYAPAPAYSYYYPPAYAQPYYAAPGTNTSALNVRLSFNIVMVGPPPSRGQASTGPSASAQLVFAANTTAGRWSGRAEP